MALFSYGRPTGITWTLTGTGAAFVGAQSLLTNGRPGDPCRMQWLSGAPGTGQSLVLTSSVFAPSIVARCAALLLPATSTANVSIPANVAVTAAGKLAGGAVALGGNALTATTVVLPNGAVAVWWVFPPAPIDQLVVTIPNTNGAAVWATSSQCTFDLGEIWVGKGADYAIKQDMEEQLMGGLLQRQSHNNQAWPLQVQPGKGYTVNLVPMSETIAIGPNPAQDDWESVAYAISTQPAVVMIPRYMKRGSGPVANGQPPSTITGATIDAQRLIRSAKLGVMDGNLKTTQAGDIYLTASAQFGETPP
jgi:hypothetical protein